MCGPQAMPPCCQAGPCKLAQPHSLGQGRCSSSMPTQCISNSLCSKASSRLQVCFVMHSDSVQGSALARMRPRRGWGEGGKLSSGRNPAGNAHSKTESWAKFSQIDGFEIYEKADAPVGDGDLPLCQTWLCCRKQYCCIALAYDHIIVGVFCEMRPSLKLCRVSSQCPWPHE